jgi:hypothetical protein
VHWKTFLPFYPPPSISSLNLSPHTEFKEALPCRMYSIIHLSKIYPFFSTPSPSIPTSILCRVFCCHIWPASFRIVGLDSEKTIGHPWFLLLSSLDAISILAMKIAGLVRDLNSGPLAPEAWILPLDNGSQWHLWFSHRNCGMIWIEAHGSKFIKLLRKRSMMGSSGIWTRDLSHPKRESYP